MRDFSDPRNDYVFAAGRFQDEIMLLAKEITASNFEQKIPLLTRSLQTLDDMRTLNQEHFGASKGTSEAIDDLEEKLRELAKGRPTDKNDAAGTGTCSVCCALLIEEHSNIPLSFKTRLGLPARNDQRYCSECLRTIIPALIKLESEEHFGTDSI